MSPFVSSLRFGLFFCAMLYVNSETDNSKSSITDNSKSSITVEKHVDHHDTPKNLNDFPVTKENVVENNLDAKSKPKSAEDKSYHKSDSANHHDHHAKSENGDQKSEQYYYYYSHDAQHNHNIEHEKHHENTIPKTEPKAHIDEIKPNMKEGNYHASDILGKDGPKEHAERHHEGTHTPKGHDHSETRDISKDHSEGEIHPHARLKAKHDLVQGDAEHHVAATQYYYYYESQSPDPHPHQHAQPNHSEPVHNGSGGHGNFSGKAGENTSTGTSKGSIQAHDDHQKHPPLPPEHPATHSVDPDKEHQKESISGDHIGNASHQNREQSQSHHSGSGGTEEPHPPQHRDSHRQQTDRRHDHQDSASHDHYYYPEANHHEIYHHSQQRREEATGGAVHSPKESEGAALEHHQQGRAHLQHEGEHLQHSERHLQHEGEHLQHSERHLQHEGEHLQHGERHLHHEGEHLQLEDGHLHDDGGHFDHGSNSGHIYEDYAYYHDHNPHQHHQHQEDAASGDVFAEDLEELSEREGFGEGRKRVFHDFFAAHRGGHPEAVHSDIHHHVDTDFHEKLRLHEEQARGIRDMMGAEGGAGGPDGLHPHDHRDFHAHHVRNLMKAAAAFHGREGEHRGGGHDGFDGRDSFEAGAETEAEAVAGFLAELSHIRASVNVMERDVGSVDTLLFTLQRAVDRSRSQMGTVQDKLRHHQGRLQGLVQEEQSGAGDGSWFFPFCSLLAIVLAQVAFYSFRVLFPRKSALLL